MKIRSVGAELFYADGHDEANSCFSQMCERAPPPKKKPRTFCPRSVYFILFFFCIYLRPDIDFRTIKYKLIGFCNRCDVFTVRYALFLEVTTLIKKMPQYIFLSLC